MGKQVPITSSFQLPDGREVTIETGKLASQAHGSAVVRCGKTMIFASVVSAYEAREGQPFFPLSVDYQEKFAAAGKIPGNFFRREARLNDYEILISRLIDRAIRPLFPDGYMNDTQVIVNLISAEEETMPDAFAALAVSSALTISDIPWAGPISEVRVAKIDGTYKVNPTRSELEKATVDVIVAATMDNVTMVEGEAKECQEKELIDAIRVGHDAIKTQCEAQLKLRELLGNPPKRELEEKTENEEVRSIVRERCEKAIYDIAKSASEKHVRKEAFKTLKDGLIEALTEEKGEEYMEENEHFVGDYFDELKKDVIRKMVLDEKVRLDGRKYDQVRDIWTEIDYLPAAHGSAIFTRGETQALTSCTIGTKRDALLIDTALAFYEDNFILHYNFPALSVGEIKPMRGPGRREVGHANLAGRSLRQVLPKDLPYTLRIVSDILESNGSSSMATVCAGSLAMMDAGIPLGKPVSGIAMGMISEGDKFAVLSDILGDEDALGDMDFKVTGTKDGICACQMDIKIDGMPYEVLEQALEQAKAGRLHILNEMSRSIAAPREEMKPHAPRVIEFSIDKEFIGAVIGPGGKVIQEIQEVTGATISIDEVDGKGVVNISAPNAESIESAKKRIDTITHVPEVGDVYEAKVATIMPYGVFVDFMGSSGLLHISEISHSHIDKVEDVFKEGDMVKVKLIGKDPRSGKLRLSRKVLMPKPEKMAQEERGNKGRSDGNGRSRRND